MLKIFKTNLQLTIWPILFLAFFSLGAAKPAPGTFSLLGKVIDSKTSQPIPGVSIKLFSAKGQLQKTAVTDANGRYALADIPAPEKNATYVITLAKTGYESSAKRYAFSRGATYALNFGLKLLPNKPPVNPPKPPPQPPKELPNPQVVERVYIYFNGQRAAMEEEGKKYFYHNDHLGSASVISDAAGQKSKSIEYKPYGDTKNEE